MTAAERAERLSNINSIFEFMKANALVLADLTEIGGGDLKGSRKQRQKARLVEKCWELMAQHSVTYAMLDPSDEGKYRVAKDRGLRRTDQEVAFEQPKQGPCLECGKVLEPTNPYKFCNAECSAEYRKKQCAALVEYHNCSLAA